MAHSATVTGTQLQALLDAHGLRHKDAADGEAGGTLRAEPASNHPLS
jgi:hypothetical protein